MHMPIIPTNMPDAICGTTTWQQSQHARHVQSVSQSLLLVWPTSGFYVSRCLLSLVLSFVVDVKGLLLLHIKFHLVVPHLSAV
jgi:hypothetical protein